MIYQIKAHSVVNGENYKEEIVTTDLAKAYEFVVNHNKKDVNMEVKLWSEDGQIKSNFNNVVRMIEKYNQALTCGLEFVILLYVLQLPLGQATHFLKERELLKRA